jgi:hypothetical protein
VDASTDSGKPNPCANKPNYVFDDATAIPGGFDLAACGAYAEVEKMVEVDATRAAQFITPLAGVKLPASKPYKFSWTKAMFPNAPMPDGGSTEPDGGPEAGPPQIKINGVGYVIIFVDANTSKELLRVHTINNDYTPDDASWAKLVAAATMPNAPGYQLKIVAAYFVDGAVPMGTNPVTGTQPRLAYLDPTM